MSRSTTSYVVWVGVGGWVWEWGALEGSHHGEGFSWWACGLGAAAAAPSTAASPVGRQDPSAAGAAAAQPHQHDVEAWHEGGGLAPHRLHIVFFAAQLQPAGCGAVLGGEGCGVTRAAPAVHLAATLTSPLGARNTLQPLPYPTQPSPASPAHPSTPQRTCG